MRFIGRKTLLLDNIQAVIDEKAPGCETFCDIFSGTATVARHFKQWYQVYSNDLLYFSYVLQRATVELDKLPEFKGLREGLGILDPIDYFNAMSVEDMEVLPSRRRFFQNTYAPMGGRMYMNDANALRIEFARHQVEDWKNEGDISEGEYYYLVACVVEGIPFVSNISGTYGAYNKTWDRRSYKQYQLYRLPVVENAKENRSFNRDGVELLRELSGHILYVDPPYNERQYLPNYHVLETGARYDFPEVKGVTAQRSYGEEKSDFCVRGKALEAFDRLMENADFEHIILSYSTDGLMKVNDIEDVMKSHGRPDTFQIYYFPYRRYKSRSLTMEEELKELLVYIRK